MRRAAFLIAFAWSATALADPTKHECVQADTQAQTLRGQDKLNDARAQLAICMAQSCPAVIRQDCTERLDEVNRIQPSLVFDVKDSSGQDVTDAKVTIDGAPLLDHIVAQGVRVDPGEHDLVFAAHGHIPNKLHVLVHEGDKDRRVSVTVGTPAAEPETPPALEQPPTEQPNKVESAPATNENETPPAVTPSSGSGQRVAGIVIGAAGLVGLALGGAFAGVAFSNWKSSQNICSDILCPSATRQNALDDHDTAITFAAASTASFIAGGVLAAAGIVVFLLAPRQHEAQAFWVRPSPMGVTLGGSFQ